MEDVLCTEHKYEASILGWTILSDVAKRAINA